MDIVSLRSGIGAFTPLEASVPVPEATQAVQSVAGRGGDAIAELAGGIAQRAELKSIGDVQRFVAALKYQAEQAGEAQSGTEGEGGGGGALPYENRAAQMTAKVNRDADRIFKLVMQFTGDDPKLLTQAKGLVSHVFAQIQGSSRPMSPLQAELTQQRVLQLIEARLQRMTAIRTTLGAVNLSA